MRVLYLVSGLGPPAGWGTEFIQNIIFQLAEKGIEATIINPIYTHTHHDWKNWSEEVSKKYNVKIISIQSPAWVKKNLMIHFLLTPFIVTYHVIKLLQHERFDLVQEFSSTPIILFRALMLRIFYKIPTVFTLSVYNDTLLGKFFWFKIFDFARFYLIPSQEIINNLKYLGINSQKLVFCPPGIDLKPFIKKIDKSFARKKLNLTNDKFIASYFGPLTTEKGVRDILLAAESINQNRKDILIVVFSIWKGSTEHNNLKNLISKLDLPNLKLIEKYVNMPLALAASDTVILPQHSGHGTTIPPISCIEVIASGTPLIATNIIGNREIITNKNGLLITPKNPLELVNAIEQIYDNPLQTSDLSLLNQFNMDKVVNIYSNIYKTLKRS